MNLETIDFVSDPDHRALWQKIVTEATDAWFWHTLRFLDFTVLAASQSGTENHSFFIIDNGRPIGLAPLLIQNVRIGSFEGREASYYGGPLPWPCFLPDLPGASEIEDFTFAELERRAALHGAARIRFRLEPPVSSPETLERFNRVTR